MLHGQVQSRLLDAKAFRDTYAQLVTDQAQLRKAVRQRATTDVHQSMKRCMELCRARDARQQRLSSLKHTLDHSRGFVGADPQTLLKFWGPHRRESTTSHSIGGSPPPGGQPEHTPRNVSAAHSPELTGKIPHSHSRKPSSSGVADFGHGRESSAGSAMHAAQAHVEHHREGSRMFGVAGSPSPGPLAGTRRESTAGVGTSTPGEEVGLIGDHNVLKSGDALMVPLDHTGALQTSPISLPCQVLPFPLFYGP